MQIVFIRRVNVFWTFLSVGKTTEPTWDGSKMTHTRNRDAEQSNSTAEEEDTELKTTAQQSLTKTGNQQTLQTLPRSTKKDSKVVEGNIRILAHGPLYLGPRTLLYIADSPRKADST